PDPAADLPTFYALGELYLRHHMPENAEEVFKKIVERAPDYRDVGQRLNDLIQAAPSLDGTLATVFGVSEPGAPRREERARPATRRLDKVDLGDSPPVATIAPGVLVADRYRIEAEIGRGGMATVYRAHDLELSEDVALKVFRPAPNDEEGLARF